MPPTVPTPCRPAHALTGGGRFGRADIDFANAHDYPGAANMPTPSDFPRSFCK